MIETDPKERIKKAAQDLLMRYSIRSVSMDDIAASVGMSKKTLYHYYEDKDELVKSVVDSVIAENQCSCEGHINAADNAVHEIFLAMEMMVEMCKTMNPSVIYEMQKYHPEAYQHFHLHKTQFLLQHIQQNIDRGIREELYRTDVNGEVLARFRVESMFIPFNPGFQAHLPNYTLLELEEQILTHFLFGLVTPKGHKLATKYMAEREKNQKIKNNHSK